MPYLCHIHANFKKEMAKTALKPEQLKTLKGKLIYGDIALAMVATDKSRRHISNVIDGLAQDLEVIEALTNIILSRSSKSNTAAEMIKSLES